MVPTSTHATRVRRVKAAGRSKVRRGVRPAYPAHPCGAHCATASIGAPPSQPAQEPGYASLHWLQTPRTHVVDQAVDGDRLGDERRAGRLEQLSGRSDTLQCGRTVAPGGGSSVAYELSVTLTDEEYAELAAEAARSGKPVEALVHDIVAQRVNTTLLVSTRTKSLDLLCFNEP